MTTKSLLLIMIATILYSFSGYSQRGPPGGGGGPSSPYCTRLEGIKGCKPPISPPPPACTPPDPKAGQPCTGTIQTCDSDVMDIAIRGSQCQGWTQECTYPPPTEDDPNPQPICTQVCTGGYIDTCSIHQINCSKNCVSSSAPGTYDNCGVCVVSGGSSSGSTCSANQTCP